MNNYKIIKSVLITFSVLGSTVSMAADNGITKEDIKRLQVNAFAEEMQVEIEKSVHSELQSSLKSTEIDIQTDVAVNAMDENTMPVQPTISSR